jgi:hypothetical protein
MQTIKTYSKGRPFIMRLSGVDISATDRRDYDAGDSCLAMCDNSCAVSKRRIIWFLSTLFTVGAANGLPISPSAPVTAEAAVGIRRSEPASKLTIECERSRSDDETQVPPEFRSEPIRVAWAFPPENYQRPPPLLPLA